MHKSKRQSVLKNRGHDAGNFMYLKNNIETFFFLMNANITYQKYFETLYEKIQILKYFHNVI